MKVSIIIPVYNEALSLPLVLQRVMLAPLPRGCEKEIIVVARISNLIQTSRPSGGLERLYS